MATATKHTKKVHVEVDAESSARQVSYREAIDLCDEETLRRVLDHGKHFHTGGRRPRPYWLAQDFMDCLGVVEFEMNRGGPL